MKTIACILFCRGANRNEVRNSYYYVGNVECIEFDCELV